MNKPNYEPLYKHRLELNICVPLKSELGKKLHRHAQSNFIKEPIFPGFYMTEVQWGNDPDAFILARIMGIFPFPELEKPKPIPVLLNCPQCGKRHVDEGEFATKEHHTHVCQHCGMVWRPALVPTVGVQFLPGFKNE